MYKLVRKLHIYPTGGKYGIKILNWDMSGKNRRMDEII